MWPCCHSINHWDHVWLARWSRRSICNRLARVSIPGREQWICSTDDVKQGWVECKRIAVVIFSLVAGVAAFTTSITVAMLPFFWLPSRIFLHSFYSCHSAHSFFLFSLTVFTNTINMGAYALLITKNLKTCPQMTTKNYGSNSVLHCQISSTQLNSSSVNTRRTT